MSYLKKLKPAGMLSGGNRKVPVVETSLVNNIFYNHYYGSYFDYKYLFDVLNFYINLLYCLRPWRAALRDFRLSLQSPFVHENSLLRSSPVLPHSVFGEKLQNQWSFSPTQTSPYKRPLHGATRVGIASQCPI